MDCKKKILPILFLVVSIYNGFESYGQNCSIYKTPYKAFGFDNSGLVGKEYDCIKRMDSSLYQIYFVTTSGKKAEAYYISVDSFNHVHLRYSTEGMIKNIDSTSLDSRGLNIYNKLKNNDTLNGYYFGSCKNVLSWSYNRTLIICNHSKGKWIEYTSIDGHMKVALKENPEYQYLLEILNLLPKFFPDFKIE